MNQNIVIKLEKLTLREAVQLYGKKVEQLGYRLCTRQGFEMLKLLHTLDIQYKLMQIGIEPMHNN
jgi:hypothetical protein